jgi:hypothetical protein
VRHLRPAALLLVLAAVAVALLARGGAAPAPAPARSAALPATSPPGARTAVVWAVGDAAGAGPAYDAVARLVNGAPVLDRFLYLGDVYETGTAADFRANYAPRWGALAPRTEPTPGNHEWPRRAEGFGPYWAAVRGRPQPTRHAFRLGGWELIALNSQAPHGPRSAQVRWLRRHLRGARGDCRLAFWHRARFAAGRDHGDDPDVAPLRAPLRGRARITVHGHEHLLQRLRPIDGITTLIAGAGGRERDRVRAGDPRVAFGDDEHDGALRLDLAPGRARMSFVAVDGTVLDRSTVRCTP